MVVLDLQIAIEQQALRDDEVVRLVAARHRRSHFPRREGKDDEGERAGRKTRPRPARARPAPGRKRSARGQRAVAVASMTSATAVQITQRIDPAQIRNAAGAGHGSHGRRMSDSSHTGASEAPARASQTTTDGRQDGGRNGDRRNRQRPDARAVKAGDGERALRQPRGDGGEQRRRGQTETGHVECWSFYRQIAETAWASGFRLWAPGQTIERVARHAKRS